MSDIKIASGPPLAQGIGEDPLLYFTRLFVRFLQLAFATFPRGEYHWDQDMELSELIISDQGMVGREVIEKRPCIAVARGGAQWLNVSMNQLRDADVETGKKTHTDLVSCSVVYNCIAREGLEAQRLAWFANYATRTLKLALLRTPGMHRVGENIAVGEEGDAEKVVPDAKDYRFVPVSVPFFFQDTYAIAPVDNLLLTDFVLRLTSQAVSQPAAGLRPPSYGGKALPTGNVKSLTQRVVTSATLKNRK